MVYIYIKNIYPWLSGKVILDRILKYNNKNLYESMKFNNRIISTIIMKLVKIISFNALTPFLRKIKHDKIGKSNNVPILSVGCYISIDYFN
ncbi:hypothetical protein BK740_19010 [Bacillus thuringiensis serovar argentinensis]|nr:hypothetical protein BK740_19010 [Bacillus thuringiensis serovar argentinensis]